jgi:TetR/AcrR family transcriptional repressor of mexJK operon
VGLFEAVIRDRTDRVMGGLAGVEALDPTQPQKALLAVGEQFLTLAREEEALGQFRSLYGAAGVQPEACRAFYRQGSERRNGHIAAKNPPSHAPGTAPNTQPPPTSFTRSAASAWVQS